MASITPLQTLSSTCSTKLSDGSSVGVPRVSSLKLSDNRRNKQHRPLTVVSAFGDVSADGTNYLIAGAVTVALVGTAFPIFFSRKDLCPVCDGAGFVRKTGATLRANAARKDEVQIVCANCKGLGKLNQVDK